MLEIRLFATLRKSRGNLIKIPFHFGITGKEILSTLSISEDEVSIFLINGFHSSFNKELSDNDIISIFPPVGGG